MLLDAGWAAMMRHAALGTEWLLRYKPQSWGPDPAVALFSNLVLLTALWSLLLWNTPYAILFALRSRAPISAPSFFDRYLIQPPPPPARADSPKATAAGSTKGQPTGWAEFRESLEHMAGQILFLWALLCFGGGSAAMLGARPEWREALEGYLCQDADKAAAAASAGTLSFPSFPRMLREMLVCLLVEDTFFYWIHRLFHRPWMFKTFHKTHHRFKAPFSLRSTYASLFDFAVGASIPLVVGLIVACSSLPAVMICGSVRLYLTTELHSGYAFPWNIDVLLRRLFRSGPRDYLWAGALHHDAHHAKTHGNYAQTFVFWDVLCGTYFETEFPRKASGDKGTKAQ